jgi:hypothetical protein
MLPEDEVLLSKFLDHAHQELAGTHK